MNTLKRTDMFLKYLASFNPIYFKAIRKNFQNNAQSFEDLAERMLCWAEALLGKDYLEKLVSGYVHFVDDVNQSQFKYEEEKRYENKSYEEVCARVYDNASYMALYHWGVFTTTFAWEHHLKIYQYFVEHFISRISDHGRLLDLGSGSGIWSLLTLSNKKNWHSTGVDISNYSVDMARQLSHASGFSENSNFIVEDALKFKTQEKVDAVVSCFLLEHLEEPERLFINTADNLKEGGYAFVTAALTAAEVDHIFEFRRESELVKLAEENGFRVISMLSESPASHSRANFFLPRSAALVLQKRMNAIW